MPAIEFGTVRYCRYSELAALKADHKVAERLVCDAIGCSPDVVLEACEFGVCGRDVVTVRMPEVVPDFDLEAAKAEAEWDRWTCHDCEKRKPGSEEGNHCRVCGEQVCESCKYEHEWACDRWE